MRALNREHRGQMAGTIQARIFWVLRRKGFQAGGISVGQWTTNRPLAMKFFLSGKPMIVQEFPWFMSSTNMVE